MSIMSGWTGTAILSATTSLDELALYRYKLSRRWIAPSVTASELRLAVVGLNPSTADGLDDDNTIRKLMGFATRWGFALFDIVNVFAYRTKSPKVLLEAQRVGVDVVGPDNDRHVADVIASASLVLAAWGAEPIVKSRWPALEKLLAAAPCNVVALKTTKDGAPFHPLYVRYDQKPAPYALSR